MKDKMSTNSEPEVKKECKFTLNGSMGDRSPTFNNSKKFNGTTTLRVLVGKNMPFSDCANQLSGLANTMRKMNHVKKLIIQGQMLQTHQHLHDYLDS
jgi:hypothetical protein